MKIDLENRIGFFFVPDDEVGTACVHDLANRRKTGVRVRGARQRQDNVSSWSNRSRGSVPRRLEHCQSRFERDDTAIAQPVPTTSGKGCHDSLHVHRCGTHSVRRRHRADLELDIFANDLFQSWPHLPDDHIHDRRRMLAHRVHVVGGGKTATSAYAFSNPIPPILL